MIENLNYGSFFVVNSI